MAENGYDFHDIGVVEETEPTGVSLESLENTGEKAFVKPSWFDGYAKGNGMWPQTGLGISLFPLVAILENPPESGEMFLKSKFSPDQMDVLGKYVSSLHHARNIQQATETHLKAGDTVIPEARLQDLWRHVKIGIAHEIIEYMKGKADIIPKPRDGYFEMDDVVITPEHVKDLHDFFTDPSWKQEREEMTKIAQAARDALLTPEGKAYATLYRAQYDWKTPVAELKRKNAELARRTGISMKREGELHTYGKSLTADGSRFHQRAVKLAITQIKNKFPSTDFSWLKLPEEP